MLLRSLIGKAGNSLAVSLKGLSSDDVLIRRRSYREVTTFLTSYKRRWQEDIKDQLDEYKLLLAVEKHKLLEEAMTYSTGAFRAAYAKVSSSLFTKTGVEQDWLEFGIQLRGSGTGKMRKHNLSDYLEMIEANVLHKAKLYNFLQTARNLSTSERPVSLVVSAEGGCAYCQRFHGVKYTVHNFVLPHHHPNCECEVSLVW